MKKITFYMTQGDYPLLVKASKETRQPISLMVRNWVLSQLNGLYAASESRAIKRVVRKLKKKLK